MFLKECSAPLAIRETQVDNYTEVTVRPFQKDNHPENKLQQTVVRTQGKGTVCSVSGNVN